MTALTAKQRNALPDSAFAGPDRSYPTNDRSHAANAKARARQAYNRHRISKSTMDKINARANKVLAK